MATMVTRGILGDDVPDWNIGIGLIEIDNGGRCRCRIAGVSTIDTRIWIQVVSSCITIVLQSQGADDELPGVGVNGSITGVGVRFPGAIVYLEWKERDIQA